MWVECSVGLRGARSDAELLVAASTDARAFGEFYDRHIATVLGFFRHRVDAELAMDLAAETFACALASVASFVPGEEPVTGWLFTIARRRWFDALRRGQVEDRARRELGMDPLTVDDHALEVIERVAAAGAMELLATLPEEQRDAVFARHIDDRDYFEIAEELRCSESVVRKRVSRGVTSLKQVAAGWAGDE